jgi:hypothetical protein
MKSASESSGVAAVEPAPFGVYSSFEAMGIMWRDNTCYSQSKKNKVPRTWNAKSLGLIMTINRYEGKWRCKAIGHEMEWIDIEGVDISDVFGAALKAMYLIHHYFIRLSRLAINSPNVSHQPLTQHNDKPKE